jgi:hypothetical protein
MSRNAIFLVKLDRPHGSIEMGEKALRQQWQRRRLWGESSISLSHFLAKADGKHEHEEGKRQGCARERKNYRVKGEKPERFEIPTTRIKCGYQNVLSRPKYLDNHSHAPCKSALAPHTICLACRTCRYPITMRGSGTSPLHGPIIGLGR